MSSIVYLLRRAAMLALLMLPLQSMAADSSQSGISQAELDRTLAPIALYPDSLLSQILMASTYPDQVAEAVKWSKANSDQKGDTAVKAVQDKAWDPSVASLVAFPQVLGMMGDKPDWVKQLGDAFLAEPDKVMNTVQGLRSKAKEAGNLKSNEQQSVSVDDSQPQQTIIKIEPADPQVVYVPTYNPTVIYGSWWWPAYPPFYYYPPGYAFAAGVATGIAFGVGVAVTNCIWGGFDWHHHDVNINVNRYNNININHKLNVDSSRVSWKHNAVNRRGTPYADKASASKYGQKLPGADSRQAYRGRDQERQKALDTLKDKGIDPAAERSKLTGTGGEKLRSQLSERSAGGLGLGSRERSADRSGGLGQGRNLSGSSLGGRTANAFEGLRDGGTSRLSSERGNFSSRGFSGRSFSGGGFGGGGLGGGHFGGRR